MYVKTFSGTSKYVGYTSVRFVKGKVLHRRKVTKSCAFHKMRFQTFRICKLFLSNVRMINYTLMLKYGRIDGE